MVDNPQPCDQFQIAQRRHSRELLEAVERKGHYSLDEDLALAEAVRAGEPDSTIARRLGRSRVSIARRRRRIGLPGNSEPTPVWTLARTQELCSRILSAVRGY